MENKIIECLIKALKSFGLGTHLKEIKYKKDAYTYAEKIAEVHELNKKDVLFVKNSYMYLDSFDFCFFYSKNRNEYAYSIAGIAYENDRNQLEESISIANDVCFLANKFLNEVQDE